MKEIIETLKLVRKDYLDPIVHTALEFAIEALTPKDPEAERRHCEDASVFSESGTLNREIADTVERERALARAEVQAQFVAERAEVCILRQDLEDCKKRLRDMEKLVELYKREADAAYEAGFEDGRG